MHRYTFNLHVSYNDFLQHYSGAASQILVRSDQGLRLQIPAGRMRPFLTQLGVKGRFRLTTDDSNKFVQIEQL